MSGDDPTLGADEPPPGADEPTVGADEPTLGADEPTLGADEPTLGAVEPTRGTAGPTPDSDAAHPPAATSRTPLWRHIANGAALAGILFIAGVVLHTAPTEEQWQAPIPVTGVMGETLAGRNIEATVSNVRVAEVVTASNGWSGPTSGVWVVVDASVSAVLTDYGVSLGTAQLEVGGTHYSASERPDQASIAGAVLSVGLPKTGPLMFEVPRDVVSGSAAKHAEIQLAIDNDPRVDSMIVVPVDLSALVVEPTITTDKPVWGVE